MRCTVPILIKTDYPMNDKKDAIPILLVLALLTDFLTPFLIWKGVIPSQTRWLSHAAIAAMIPLSYVRMMLGAGVPWSVYFVLVISGVGGFVAMAQGQGLLATAWGGWLMLQFPLAGLYCHLWSRWPSDMPERIRKFIFRVLVLQVLVQMAQFATGEPPGDNLAGLFGEHGTGQLVLFLLISYAVGLGHWLVTGRWQTAMAVLMLGGIASALGEVKMFFLAGMVLTAVALVFSAMRDGSFIRLVPIGLASAAAFVIIVAAYETVVVGSGASDTSLMAYLDKDTRDQYMGAAYRTERGDVAMGRNYALAHGWETIKQSNTTFLFGYGIGARGESRSLGTTGAGLEEERGDFTTGTGLLVLLHEMGLFGLAFMAICYAWIVKSLIGCIRRDDDSGILELRLAVLMFSLLWPILLWYNHSLTLRAPMLFYWALLGYVLREPMTKAIKSRTQPTAEAAR